MGTTPGTSGTVRARLFFKVSTYNSPPPLLAGTARYNRRPGVPDPHPGVCINDITDHLLLDELAGTSAINGVPVTVEAARPAPAPS